MSVFGRCDACDEEDFVDFGCTLPDGWDYDEHDDLLCPDCLAARAEVT